MQYERDGKWRKVVRVTGPRHNFLAVALDAFRGKSAPEIEALGACKSPRVRAEDVLSQVEEGVAQANSEFGTQFSVGGVQYLPDDTPGDAIYRQLAREIVMHAIAEESKGTRKLAAG
jgi:hypothetical protein